MHSTRLKTIVFLALMAALALSCSQSGKTSADRLKRGDAAPLGGLPELDGNREVVLAKEVYNAHASVFIFWSMACPSCREALLECQKVYDEYSHTATVFYGINFDIENTQGVRAFLKGEGVTIPHLWDRGQRMTKDYKALDYTFSAFVLDSEGIIVLAQYDHPPDLTDRLREAINKQFPGGAKP
jgi:peroxiredoxin